MRTITKYVCDKCKTEYQHYDEATYCEDVHKAESQKAKQEEAFRLIFPARHKKNNKYTKHCVSCGKKLMEWQREFDGHRAEVGPRIYTAPDGSFDLFGGSYCHKCYEATYDLVVKTLLVHMPRVDI